MTNLLAQGDTFKLNVINSLTDLTMLRSTSIVRFIYFLNNAYSRVVQHWHGIFQEGSSWADGPAGVTQCPISPSHSFLYQFNVLDQAGTFWYHYHLCAYILFRILSPEFDDILSYPIL